MSNHHFLSRATGPCAGAAYLEESYADVASYPPKGLGRKFGFRLLDLSDGDNPEEAALRVLEDPNSPFSEPYAPAGCFPLGNEEYLFFGRLGAAEYIPRQSAVKTLTP